MYIQILGKYNLQSKNQLPTAPSYFPAIITIIFTIIANSLFVADWKNIWLEKTAVQTGS